MLIFLIIFHYIKSVHWRVLLIPKHHLKRIALINKNPIWWDMGTCSSASFIPTCKFRECEERYPLEGMSIWGTLEWMSMCLCCYWGLLLALFASNGIFIRNTTKTRNYSLCDWYVKLPPCLRAGVAIKNMYNNEMYENNFQPSHCGFNTHAVWIHSKGAVLKPHFEYTTPYLFTVWTHLRVLLNWE